jgi:hypothetical protein
MFRQAAVPETCRSKRYTSPRFRPAETIAEQAAGHDTSSLKKISRPGFLAIAVEIAAGDNPRFL